MNESTRRGLRAKLHSREGESDALTQARVRLAEAIKRSLGEAEAERLTDAKMKSMIPLFVPAGEAPDNDHKCGSCFMRIEKPGADNHAHCTIVEGCISLTTGTCVFWAFGKKGSSEDDIHEMRMSHDLAGYVEGPVGFEINCATCRFFSGRDGRTGYCRLWEAEVDPGACCISYDAPEVE